MARRTRLVGRSPQPWYVEGGLQLASYLSLVVVVAGFLTGVTGWLVVGLLLGGAGVVWPWVALGRSHPVAVKVMTALGIVVADLSTLVLMWVTT